MDSANMICDENHLKSKMGLRVVVSCQEVSKRKMFFKILQQTWNLEKAILDDFLFTLLCTFFYYFCVSFTCILSFSKTFNVLPLDPDQWRKRNWKFNA